MVEAVVSFAVEKLGDLLIKEVVFLAGVHEQVRQLQNELRRMQCFLEDADAKQETDERVSNWVAEIRSVAYDAEDVIDTFILKVRSSQGGGIHGLLKKYSCIFNKGVNIHLVGRDIQGILTRIPDISTSRIKYGITNVGAGVGSSSSAEKKTLQRQLRQSFPHIEDEDTIGLEENIMVLVKELTKEEERRRVVSIIGVGGLGKTTLAKKVYNHDVIKRHFDCHAWTFVSQECSRKEVLKEVMKKTGTSTDVDSMNEEDLVEKLYKFLQGKRYLVVLDDIWEQDHWDILSRAFPIDGKIGSKILLTTRKKELALHADPWSLHLEPRFLTNKEGWELLCKKAFDKCFAGTSNSVMAGLEIIGREMLEKCSGLPLGITVLGGLLATKKPEINEWKIVQKHMKTYMRRGQNGVLGILALSYHDLPYHLKPCFLYLGLFPEDFEIPRGKLIRLWSAEGFIPQQQGDVTMEEVGEHQLGELIQRCMVQIGERGLTGRVKTCRMHDLMRDLCLLKATKESFLQISLHHHENNLISSGTNHKFRRFAVHDVHDRYSSLPNSSSQLRTLFLTARNNSNTNINRIMKSSYASIRLLRVLDLRAVPFDTSERYNMKEITKLIHLRYLALSGVEAIVPLAISNLRYLRTLVVAHSVGSLPSTISKLEHLRHLYISSHCKSGHLRMDTLTNLQTLKQVYGGQWIEGGDLEKMANLRKLGICFLTRSQVELVLASTIIRSPDYPLQSLYLHSDAKEGFPSLEPLACCHHLIKLSLSGIIENLPRFSPNLIKLCLLWSELQQDPMEALQDLPNLMHLELRGLSFPNKEMVCSATGFPQLQRLYLYNLDGLVDWRLDQGGMPCLKYLDIFDNKQLTMFPEGLRFLTTLEKLVIGVMPNAFTDMLREGGEDRYKIQHIPSIKIGQLILA